MTTQWEWWRAALKGEFGPITSTPEQGYYRTRDKAGQWEAVAIWQDDQGTWYARRDGRPTSPDDVWTWACRNPITHEAYERAIDGNGWADEPPLAAIGDNSGDIDPFDKIKRDVAAEAEQLRDFMKVDVTTQAEADRCAIWAKRLSDLAKVADLMRETEKAPHLAAGRAVDEKFRDVIANAKDWATKAKRHIEAFLIAKKRAEEKRDAEARAEAERLRREADEAAQRAAYVASAGSLVGDTSDEETQAELRRIEDDRQAKIAAAQAAERASEVNNASAGRTGARASIRTEKVGVVTDYAKAAAALVKLNHPDIREVIDRLANRAAKAGMPFDGMEVQNREVVR
jgi:hypothetical protein